VAEGSVVLIELIRRAAVWLPFTAGVVLFTLQSPAMASTTVPKTSFWSDLGSSAVSVTQAEQFIPNLALVAPNFYRGGQPTYEGLRRLKAAGVKVDVCLVHEKKYVAEEAQQAQKLGLKFIHIPLHAFHRPSNEDISRFLDATSRKDSEPLFVHCLHGRDRTGAMVAIYREAKEHVVPDQAYKEMLKYGFCPIFFPLANTVFDYGAKLGMDGHRPSLSLSKP
jgi:tyrosine-protein phosphatase SIW14